MTQKLPVGWDEQRVRRVLEYYEQQTDEDAAAEDKAALAGRRCYCCGEPATTKEHVVPRCLYPEAPKAKLLTVPACRQCNNALAKDEEYLRTILVGAWIDNPAAREVWEQKVLPSFDRGRDGLRKLLLENMREFYLPSPQGFVETALFKADASRMDHVAEKIVRALYYHGTGRILPLDAKMRFHWQPKGWLPDIALRGRPITVDPQVFACRYGITSGQSPERSLWWMLFYRSFMYIVTVEAFIDSTSVKGRKG